MQKREIYATKDLTIDARPVKKGDVLATIETSHDSLKILSGLQNGAASFDKPKEEEKPKDEDKAAAPAPKGTPPVGK